MREGGDKAVAREIVERIDRDLTVSNFEMEVRAIRVAGAPDKTNGLPFCHELAALHLETGEVSVDGGERVGMTHDDHIAVAANLIGRINHMAGARRFDRGSLSGRDINPVMVGGTVKEPPLAKGRAELPPHRPDKVGGRIQIAIGRVAGMLHGAI